MNWKKILIWVVIILVLLFVIGLISDNSNKTERDEESGTQETVAEQNQGVFEEDTQETPPGDTQSHSQGTTPTSGEDDNQESVVLDLTESDLDTLEQEINNIQSEDLAGLED